jgi:hypothetical protein
MWGNGSVAPCIINLGPRGRGMMRYTPAALPPGQIFVTLWIEGCLGAVDNNESCP